MRWLLGATPRTVLVLDDAAIAAAFADYGHDVTEVRGSAEELPFPPRSIDVVVAPHGVPDDLASITKVLRPGGQLALICNERDQRIPWARKLDQSIGAPNAGDEPARDLVNSTLFGFVSDASFRYWQVVNHISLEALVRAELRHLDDAEADRRTAAALDLYADYGRGADGMQLPWVSRCFKATVVENAWAPPHSIDEERASGSEDGDESGTEASQEPPAPQDGSDSDLLLIDFR